MKIKGIPVVAVANRRIPKSEQQKGFFYTPFSLANIFNCFEVGPCLYSKKVGTIITPKPIVINKFKNVIISREEALLLEREYYKHEKMEVSA